MGKKNCQKKDKAKGAEEKKFVCKKCGLYSNKEGRLCKPKQFL
jgi:hypothetical protein